MATNLAIDDRLLEEALQIGGQPTKKETVNQALLEERDARGVLLAELALVEFARFRLDP